ncbi:MAG: PTS transporter subunit EIIB, partial [Clostridia bacterium]|nr:PTS transporter subunit EIIB [Clostridia bacterium]
MNCRALAKSILSDIGGFENIVSFTHCLTRLRFNLKDEERVDAAHLKETRGVMGVITSGGQYQVVVGNNVAQVYNELNSIIETPESISVANVSRTFGIRDLLYIIKGVFLPLLPVLAGEALLGGIIFLLMRTGIADNNSKLILWLSVIFKSVFYFLPFLFGFTVSKTFTVNPIIIMTAVGIISYSEV